MEKCWDVVGRNNPKLVKISNAKTSTAKPINCDVDDNSSVQLSESGRTKITSPFQNEEPSTSTVHLINLTPKRPTENVPANVLLANMLKEETENNESLNILRMDYIRCKIEAQRAKRDYYVAKRAKLDQ